jgi:hypothetical protein
LRNAILRIDPVQHQVVLDGRPLVIEAEGEPQQRQDALAEIRSLEGTIRARLLY